MGLDFEVHAAEDGPRALQLCRLLQIDAVVADIKMPGMSGIDFVKALRADSDQRLRSIPVILLTGEQAANLRQDGLAAGADAFIEKPVTGDTLRDTIARVLKRP